MLEPLNIVIPMAGLGSRFRTAGFTDPKPLILVEGKPMIQWVIANIQPSRRHRFIFLCLRDHLDQYPKITRFLEKLCPNSIIVPISEVTEGAACTVLLAREYIDNDSPLMIANSDQLVDLNIDDYLAHLDSSDALGLIMTFWSDHPKWSYCRKSDTGAVTEVVEKRVISNEATVGIYNFRHGSNFVTAADHMIATEKRVNGEFYVAPVYNELIRKGASVVTYNTGKEGDGMHGLGTPDDLERFLRRQRSKSH